MDDRRILAEMERHLSRDDPELAALMDALNHQFPDQRKDIEGCDDASGRRFDWRWKAGIAFVIVAVVGLLLTAILTAPSRPADDNHGPPNGRLPAVTGHSQRRSPGPGASRGAAPARQGRRNPEPPKGEPHART
ncbi:DUF3040 domain-containing protein [Streptomyces sp. NPDC093591]|uniref:DUF3040 domain-containing protein n=1 Tax=Streptomyces sp. NPDC093591 TaxID=3366044 RepID=UPI003822C16B